MSTWKLIQRRCYDLLSYKYSLLVILVAFTCIFIGIVHFGEVRIMIIFFMHMIDRTIHKNYFTFFSFCYCSLKNVLLLLNIIIRYNCYIYNNYIIHIYMLYIYVICMLYMLYTCYMYVIYIYIYTIHTYI